MSLAIGLDPSLAGRVRLGVVVLEDVTVRERDGSLDAEVEQACAEWRRRHPGASSGEVPATADARNLYKALSLDPTRNRPSNEALLRRALKGEPLYRINTLVDALNLCSLVEQLPFGLYDLEQVEPPVVLRSGRPGESYQGIRKGPVGVAGRPVLADGAGPFGNPTSDSARTSIRPTTRQALVTCYAPFSCRPERLLGILDRTRDALVRFCGGRETHRQVL